MRTIDVYNREQFRMLVPDPDVCVISCQTPPTTWGEGTLSEIPTGWGDSLVLEFHDVLQQSSPEMVVFDANMADRVVRFVEWSNNRNCSFVIHCDAGQSRSVAIGLWLSQYHDYEEETPMRFHAAPHAGGYNSTVLRELRRAENRYWYGEEYTFPDSE
jgi:predicted protein tyrosine phosphatase